MSQWLPNIYNDPDFREFMEACDKILAVKGADYANQERKDQSEQRLANFYSSAEFFGVTPFQALGQYWFKHLTAIFRFLKEGRVESEPIEGRLHDAVNYLLLLYKLIRTEARKKVGYGSWVGPSVDSESFDGLNGRK